MTDSDVSTSNWRIEMTRIVYTRQTTDITYIVEAETLDGAIGLVENFPEENAFGVRIVDRTTYLPVVEGTDIDVEESDLYDDIFTPVDEGETEFPDGLLSWEIYRPDPGDHPKWHEYKVDFQRPGDGPGDVIREWDSYTETYNGMQKLTKQQCREAIEELKEAIAAGDWSDWF